MNTRRDNKDIYGHSNNTIQGWWESNKHRLELDEERELREKKRKQEWLWLAALFGAGMAMALIAVIISATVGW